MIFIDILQIYWILLFGSLAFAILFLFIGDLFDGLLDGFIHPLLVFGTLAVVSGSGVLLTRYTTLTVLYVLFLSLIIGIVAYILIYYFLVIPLSKAESSNSHSIQDLRGRTGQVITTIPANGYGEVLLESVSGSRGQTAKSFDKVTIKQGTNIVVVNIEDRILYVSVLEDI